MQRQKILTGFLTLIFLLSSLPFVTSAQSSGTQSSGTQSSGTQSSGTLRGTITQETTGSPIHNVIVTISRLNRSTGTDDKGVYEFQNVPPGTYDVIAHLDLIPDVVQRVEVSAGSTITADFQIRITARREEVTVTATGSEETSFNSIQSVTSISSIQLIEKNSLSLGEATDHELGVAKRSFGPGSSRPVIRGFDSDRVLVLQDGNRIGSLGFQSGDHGEPIDILSLDKLEVVKGPSTLLYGSSAIGGVVNAITGHEAPHEGVRGYVTALGSTNNYQAGGSGGIELGTKRWTLWGSGSGQRAGDYETPIGRITNSYTRGSGGSGGFGYYPGKGFMSLDYTFDKTVYGVPFNPAEEDPEIVHLDPRRHSIRLNAGLRDLESFVNRALFSFQYNDYRHGEINSVTDEVNTLFRNKTFTYRGAFDQRQEGRWSGSFGLWGLHRDYDSIGEEALAPPTRQTAFALFALEKVDFQHIGFQFGGRFEHNGYNPDQILDRPTPDRSFDGFSGAVGLRVPTWEGGAFVANYTHSYRAPALEELYNRGPHPGNATFEIGNPNLDRERGDGIDLSVRHSSNRLRAEFNLFYYKFKDFIFLAPTGEVEDGLIVANYAQGSTRYTGTELRFDAGLHQNIWLLSGLDYVNAKLTDTDTPLPRIPPLRGRVGLEFTYKGFRFYPEAVMAKDQDRVFPTETRTGGYSLFNVTSSYTVPHQHYAHIFSVNAFNLGDRLYHNHLSFIKDFAPEIGRGMRVTYTLRFF
jgi:iron complex outermembrane recepter protein